MDGADGLYRPTRLLVGSRGTLYGCPTCFRDIYLGVGGMGFRSFGLMALAFLAACGGGGGDTTEVIVEPVVLSGVVRDSLAQRGIPDMLVVFGDTGALTEADGSFEFPVPAGTSGTLLVVTDNPLYAQLSRSLTVASADVNLGNLHPMRNAPYVSGFTVLPNGNIEATISHQAGAASARRPNTWLVINHGLSNQSSTYPSTWWNWTQTGTHSWRVDLPLGMSGIQNAFFNLYGPNDVQTVALCTTAGCSNDSF